MCVFRPQRRFLHRGAAGLRAVFIRVSALEKFRFRSILGNDHLGFRGRPEVVKAQVGVSGSGPSLPASGPGSSGKHGSALVIVFVARVTAVGLDLQRHPELVVVGIEGGSGQRCVVSLGAADGQPATVGVLFHFPGTGGGRFLVDALDPFDALPLGIGQGVAFNGANDALVSLSLNGRHLVALRPSLRPEDRHPLPLFGDIHHLHALVGAQFIADRLVGSSGAGKAARILAHLAGSVPFQSEPVAFPNRLEQSPGLGPDALNGSRGGMAVHLHLTGIIFRRGFHAGGGNHGDDLSGGCREAQGAPIALDHVQIGGRAAGAGRLVGIQLLNLVVQLARTSGDGGFGMAVRTLEGDGTARGSFDGDLSGFGIAGGAPFEGMLVAQGDGREGGRFGKGAGNGEITSSCPS